MCILNLEQDALLVGITGFLLVPFNSTMLFFYISAYMSPNNTSVYYRLSIVILKINKFLNPTLFFVFLGVVYNL